MQPSLSNTDQASKPAWEWLVFDATGTLFLPDPHPAEVYHQVAIALASFDQTELLSVSTIKENLAQAMATHFSPSQAQHPTDETCEKLRWRQIARDSLGQPPGDGSSEDWFDKAFETLWYHFARHENWIIYCDVAPVISLVRQHGVRIAIASNFDARLRDLITGFGIEGWFDEILISSELGWCKPNVNFYQVAAERLQLSSPQDAVMIGDTYQGDVVAAKQAGWNAYHLVRDRPDALLSLVTGLLQND